jgi:hypothetical protein
VRSSALADSTDGIGISDDMDDDGPARRTASRRSGLPRTGSVLGKRGSKQVLADSEDEEEPPSGGWAGC